MVLVDLCYLIAAVMFVIGLKGMTKPRTAVRGNTIGSLAMLLAVVATLLHRDVVSWTAVLIAIAVGSAVGVAMAKRVQMTSMPQLVAMFNGLV
jgi:H+-translocating NAD(P) transhydrogenase subunit beta